MMGKKRIVSSLTILVFSLFFAQCEQNDIYNTSGDKAYSILTFDVSSMLAYPAGINIQVGTTNYAPASTYNFGTISATTTSTVTFTIQNTGTGNITLSGPPIVAVGGLNAADFSAVDPAVSLLAPGSSSFFSVNFTPTATGPRYGAITIQSDDPNRPTYTIMLTGFGSPLPQPNLDVWIGLVNHAMGDPLDFGNVTANTSSTIAVTIRNTGAQALNITSHTIGGAQFTTDLLTPSINPGSSTNFDITFTPTASVGFSDVLTIISDDPDEASYTINLTGTGEQVSTLSPVNITSDNANNSHARIGNMATVSFTSNVAIQIPTVTIAGNAAAVGGGSTAWTATCTMDAADAEGIVPFTISNIMDLGGNSIGNVTATTDGSSVTFDRTGPSVTVNQDVGQTDPTGLLPINFRVTFSEPVTGFDVSDITNVGTATGIAWNLSTADNITWTLSATAVAGQGTLVPSIAAGAVADVAGNVNTAATSTDNSVLYDATPPTCTIDQAVGQADPTNALPVNFTVTFNEAINPATFTAGDITQSGSATGITWNLSTADNITWNLSAVAVTGQGTLIPSIAAGAVTDFAGNINVASTSTDNSVLHDATPPSVAIDQAVGQADPTNTPPINFTVVFSEAIDPATFTVSDINQAGIATGITWNLSTADNITWTLAATSVTGQGTIIPTMNAGAVTDTNGNANTASTSTDNSVLYDTTPPSVTINQAVGQADPTNSTPVNFTVIFSEAVTGFDVTDITTTGTATGVTWNLSTADNITWNLSATSVAGAGTLVPSIAAGAATDAAGNANAASTSTDNNVLFDTTAPTVTIDQAVGQVDPANVTPVNFTVVFSKPVNPVTFTVADITQSGTASGIIWNLSTADNITWTLAATAITGDGTLIPNIAVGAVTDAAGNANGASTSTDNSVLFDASSPSVTISQAVGQLDPTSTTPINFTVVFSEAINPATFMAADINQSGTATGITWNLSSADNITWTLSATSVSGQGTLVPEIAASAVTDMVGNPNAASTSIDNSVLYDTAPPSVTINQAVGQADPANVTPVDFTVVFSEAIDPASFTPADIIQGGTAAGVTWNLTSADNITWILRATAVAGEGTLIPSIAPGAVTDGAGNANLASTSTDNSVLLDTTPPTVTIDQAVGQADPTNTAPVDFTVTFSEAINPASFTAADINQGGTATGITWNLSTADNITWTLSATWVGAQGTLVPNVPAGMVTDVAGNPNTASSATDNSVLYDSTPPTVIVNQAAGQADPTNAPPINFTIVFSEPIDPASFAAADINQGGSATGITWNLSTADNITWTLSALAVTGQGTLMPSIPASAVTDMAGNPNAASASTDNTVGYDTTPPTVTIEQAGAQLDPTNSMPVDFNVVFSEAIDPGTFTVADINQSGTATGVTWSLSTADNMSWTLSATAIAGDGTLVPDITAGLVTDAAGNPNAASTSTDNSVLYDMSPPSVTVDQAVGQADPTNAVPINFTVVFSEAINPASFTTSDIFQGGTATGVTWNLSTADNITWTLSAIGVTGQGTVVPNISAGDITDGIGNANTASTSIDNSVLYDATGPTITNAVTMDADNNGRIDHYKITFDNAVKDSSFIPGNWVIGDYAGIALVNGGSAPEADTIDDNVIYLRFTEKTFPDTGVKPDITVAFSGIKDLAGNSMIGVNTVDVVEKDGARPRIESVVGAATSDRVMVTFSEPVDSSAGMACSGNVTSLAYADNAAGNASSIGAWQDNNACDDATVVFLTNLPVQASDIDADTVMPPASIIYDNADNTASPSPYILHGMINSVKFRFNTTATGANVANNVNEFPVLIRITDPNIIDATMANANDIRFVDPIADGGTILPYQIERWDQATNEAEVWVLVPTVTGNSDTDYITMYYNDKTNGTVPGRQEPGKVFSTGTGNSFAGVWHMSENDAVIIQDSTVNKNNSSIHTTTKFTGTPILGPSVIGPSQNFSGSTYVQFDDTAVNNGDALDGTASGGLTVSAWVKPANGNFGTLQSIIAKQASTFANDGYQLLTQTSTENITYRAYSSYNLNDTLAANTIQTDWYYFVAYLDSGTSTGSFYFNGADTSPLATSGSPHVVANETAVTLGRQLDGSYPFTGYMDEIRVENTFRGADWIKLCYENQRPNQTLISSWYNDAWNNRIKITVNKSLVSSSGIDQFPVYVDLSRMPALFFTNVHYANGDDILVTAGDGITRLPRELVSYNAGVSGELWFKAPSLSVSYNSYFYIYYNSTSTEADDAANVWSNGYVGVWHMQDLSGKDSTGKHTALYISGMSVPGTIGNGIQFNGLSDYIKLTDSGSVTWGDTFRIIAWFTPTSSSSTDMPIVSKTDNATGGFEMIVNPSLDLIELWTYPSTGDYSYADMFGVYDITAGSAGLYNVAAVNNYAYVYYNGQNVADDTAVDVAAPSGSDLYIGKYATSAGYLDGTLDEVRIHNVNMGNGWQITEMNNMRLQTSFITISTPETK